MRPAANEPLRILCVHGVNTPEHLPHTWQPAWSAAIDGGIRRWDMGRPVETRFVEYNDFFQDASFDAADVAGAAVELLGSGIWHSLNDAIGFWRSRGFNWLSRMPSRLRWTAGMIVQWARDDDLRAKLRAHLLDETRDFNPHVIAAHSLGSLICHDTLNQTGVDHVVQGRTLLTFGSQIGNPFVCSQFGGRIEMSPALGRWFHLFNAHDDVFTSPLSIVSPRFRQVHTPFDLEGIGDHQAGEYLSHEETVASIWSELVSSPIARSAQAADSVVGRVASRASRKRRALLVGIDEYPDEASRLQGCVNDVYLMSEVLQESGFQPEDIRVVLNDRATADAIRERLDWLLEGIDDDPNDPAIRFLHYSGHGARIPTYGVLDEIDHLGECLVPWDFRWDDLPRSAVLDDDFRDLYSQIPYSAWFVAVLDCCHSGGMTRRGDRVRGIEAPDDVRHRATAWGQDADLGIQRWRPRPLAPVLDHGSAYAGAARSTRRIGCSTPLRTQGARKKVLRARMNHQGPYLPILLQACQESELAAEHVDGARSFGAFTYALAMGLRQANRSMTFLDLIDEAKRRLRIMGYEQNPAHEGPDARLKQVIPFRKTSRR